MNRSILLNAENLSKTYGAKPLFAGVCLSISEGDRIGLIGPNGSGKTTLLRLLAGMETPDEGAVTRRRGIRFGCAEQTPVFEETATVQDVLEGAAASEPDPAERARRVAVTLGRAGFADGAQRVAELSGGWRKRLAVARELVLSPDILLLDEPTNHLDLEGILWLESLLRAGGLTFVVVSHDRFFLENVTNRTIEIDRRHAAGFFESAGRFSDFLERREEALTGQAAHQASLANRVRREIEWLRRGPKARTTKSEARIKEAGRLIEELGDLKERAALDKVGIDFTPSERRTKRLLVARGLGKSFGTKTVLSGLDLTLTPGYRLGLMGPNGSGKTTLLRLLAGELNPDAGRIERAQNLSVVYFEQNRETLNLDLSLRRALAPEGDMVIYRGRPLHVAGWARRFLFRPEQLDAEVGRLSGGERARILIARLMLRPADVLILDEPTNDLDIPALEVLEESLSDFPGALVLVTHDRYLLDEVSSQLLALDGTGQATFFADYAQYAAARTAASDAASEPVKGQAVPARRPVRRPEGVKRLTYLERREWEGMEERILAAEEWLQSATAAVNDPAIASDPVALQNRLAELASAQEAVEILYARWAELEAKQK